MTSVRAQSPEAETVTVRTTTGPPVSGKLVGLDAESLELITQAGEQTRLPRETVIVVDRHPSPAEEAGYDPLVLLTNGDCLVGTTTSLVEEKLSVAWSDGTGTRSLAVPLELASSIVLSHPNDPSQRMRFRRQWGLLKPQEDRLLLLSGTSVTGELADLDRDQVDIETSLGLVQTPREEAAAIIMNAQLSTKPQRPQQYTIVSLVDGTRLTMEELRMDPQGNLYGRAVAGFLLSIPAQRLLRVQFFHQRIVSLTDLDPLEYAFTPYLNQSYPLVTNRNVAGGTFKLRGNSYATGLGTHSQSEVTYDLAGRGFRKFSATIGIDDLADGRGQAAFAVAVDGQRVFESGNVTGQSDPIPLDPIDVSAAEQLTLIVEFGRRGNILDLANWCDPVLIK